MPFFGITTSNNPIINIFLLNANVGAELQWCSFSLIPSSLIFYCAYRYIILSDESVSFQIINKFMHERGAVLQHDK